MALRAYDFAKEHGMLDMMKQKGLTDELIKRLEVGRARAKIVSEAMDAEADMISENMGRSTLTAEQRRECIDKMALGMALQAETVANKEELDAFEQPVQRADETSAQYADRMTDEQISMVCAYMQNNPMTNLGRLLESAQNIRPKQPQNAAARNQAVL